MLDLRPLNERVYTIILDRLISGEMALGQRLDAYALAQDLGVSRTPVKEALNRLAVEGLIEISPRRGTRVIVPTLRDIEELYELRKMAELFAVDAALRNATDEDLARFRMLVEGLDAYIDGDGYRDYPDYLAKDHAMHVFIVSLAGNKRLTTFYGDIAIHVWLTRMGCISAGYRVADAAGSRREHLAIAAAFAERSAEKLRAALATHVDNRLEHLCWVFRKAFKSGPTTED